MTRLYIRILLHVLFHYGLSQDIEYSSPCYTLGPCCLSTLHVLVCICSSRTPSPSLPHTPSPRQLLVCSLWLCDSAIYFSLSSGPRACVKGLSVGLVIFSVASVNKLVHGYSHHKGVLLPGGSAVIGPWEYASAISNWILNKKFYLSLSLKLNGSQKIHLVEGEGPGFTGPCNIQQTNTIDCGRKRNTQDRNPWLNLPQLHLSKKS